MQTELEKEFVPYEEALALKELGFDEPCLGYYHVCNTDELKEIYECDYFFHEKSGNFNSNCLLLAAPTFSQAFRWFREKYKIMYTVNYNSNDKWYGSFTKIGGDYSSDYTENFETFEEAQLASLNKLIELCKQN
jgi:hypothetical protein